MVKKHEVLDQMKSLSDRISTQVRTIALGLLALTWGLLIGESEAAAAFSGESRHSLILIGGIAIITMCFDFLQYLFGYRNTYALLKEMEREGKEKGQYRTADWAYKLRSVFFVAKQISLGVAVVWFIVNLIVYFSS